MERAAAGRGRAEAGRDGDAAGAAAFLAPQFAKFWLPDAFEFVDAIPRTSAGKFKKSELRDQLQGLSGGGVTVRIRGAAPWR